MKIENHYRTIDDISKDIKFNNETLKGIAEMLSLFILQGRSFA